MIPKRNTEPCVTEEQVIHNNPNQVKSIEELVIGGHYVTVHTDVKKQFSERVFELVEIDCSNPKPEKIRVRYMDGSENLFYLSDKGVVPYANGLWHKNNYLARVKKKLEI